MTFGFSYPPGSCEVIGNGISYTLTETSINAFLVIISPQQIDNGKIQPQVFGTEIQKVDNGSVAQ